MNAPESTTKQAHAGSSPARSRDSVIAGVDDGYAMTKVALPDGKLFKIPSQARAGLYGVTSIAGNEELDCGYETQGQRYTVSEHTEGEGTRFDEYPFSPLNRVVVQHALRVAGLSGKAVHVATGLPVSHYFVGAKPNLELIHRKRRSLQTTVTPVSECAESVQIVANHVFAEGIAAWIDHAIDSTGKVNVNMGAPCAVVDIGGRTTDCVLVLPGLKVDHARLGTGEIGVLKLYDVLANRVREQHGLSEVPLHLLEQAAQTGRIRLWGKEHDFSQQLREAKAEIEDQIQREVQRRIGRGAELERVLFVGGGAALFGGLKQAFPNAAMSPQPEFANARGLLKYMLFVM